GVRVRSRMAGGGRVACGAPGAQLTWMDASVGGHPVTPRTGKPVEVEALWVNALRCAGGRYNPLAERAQSAFRARFWNAAAGCLHDVVDADHQTGRVDPSVRPNQILAVGGLPSPLVDGDGAASVVA